MPELTSAQVRKLTGLTARQVQWYDERGIVSPVRTARHRRFYSTHQVIQLHIIAQLRRKGMSLQVIRRLKAKLACHPTGIGTKFVCTNGKRVGSCLTAMAVINFALGCTGPIYVVEIPNWDNWEKA